MKTIFLARSLNTSAARYRGGCFAADWKIARGKGLSSPSPFDKLRVNGSDIEIGKDLPFVLSASISSGQALSKHGFQRASEKTLPVKS